MERNVGIILVALLMTATTAKAQSDDFGIWGEVNVEKKISSRWSAGTGVEFRSRDNASEADRWSFGADIYYKITDWLKASAGYSLLNDNNYKVNDSGKKYAKYWGLRHRINVSLTASQSFGNLSVSLRERWQYTYRPEKTVTRYYVNTTNSHDAGDEADEHTYSSKSKNVWRNRLQLKYKVSKMWRPYISAESSIASGLEKIRYAAGTEIRLNKQHSLDVKYLFQKAYDDDEGDRHVLGIGYTYKF